MRTYRMGATIGPLLAWTLISIPVIAGFVAEGLDGRTDERWVWFGVAGSTILLGPLSFLVYLARYVLVRVAIGPTGLLLSKRRELPWERIERIEIRGWLPGGWNPFSKLEIGGCGWVAVAFLFKVVLAILFVVLVVWILRVVFLPVFVLYSPWQSRVEILLDTRARLVYRDLADAEEFVDHVRSRIGRDR
jgi:hypothetical protein